MSQNENEKLTANEIENITWCVGACEVLYRQLGELQIRLSDLQREYSDLITNDMPRPVMADKIASLADAHKSITDKLSELAK